MSVFLSGLAIFFSLITGFFSGGWFSALTRPLKEWGGDQLAASKVFSRWPLKSLAAPASERPQVIVEVRKPVRLVGEDAFVLAASSGLAIDVKNEVNLFEQDADRQVPIASISKLMAALIFLEHNPGWQKIYTIREEDKRDGAKQNFFQGEQVKVRDLFYSALVASDNSAIISLVHSTGLNEGEFVILMNEKARRLGMDKTHFVEPTGLSELNISTARDVAKLAQAVLADLDVKRAVLADKYELEILPSKKKRVIRNTDELLKSNGLEVKVLGGKTGYLTKAGYCFVGNFSKDGREIITVVLGAADREARFTETAKMLNWVFKNYQWLN